MLEPLEPVVALGFGKGNDRERLQVELPTIEHYEAPTYFKIARLGRLFQLRFSKLLDLNMEVISPMFEKQTIIAVYHPVLIRCSKID